MWEKSALPQGAQSGGNGWEAPSSVRLIPPDPWAPRWRPAPAKYWAAPRRYCPLAHQNLGTGSPGRRGWGRGGGAIPAGIFPGRARLFSHPTLWKFLLLPNNIIKPPRQVGSLLPTSPSHTVLLPAHTLTPTIGVPHLAVPSFRSPGWGGGRRGREKPLLEVHLCVQVPKTSGQFFWQANPISVCSARI